MTTAEQETPVLKGNAPNPLQVGECKIMLKAYRKKGKLCKKYVWFREGVPVSPTFSSFPCAVLYGQKMPLLSDREWVEHFDKLHLKTPKKD